MNLDNIKICLIQPSDITSVVEFIVTHFVRDEPLCSLEPKLIVTDDIQSKLKEAAAAGMSVKAVENIDGCEKLVAVNIAMPISTKTAAQDHFDKAALNPNTKYGQMLQLSGFAFKNADISNRFNVDQVFYSYLSCVEPNYRGKKIGHRMKMQLMAIGKQLGYPMLTIQCTGFYSAMVVKRLGWENVFSIAYKDYVDEKGVQVFKPAEPHVAFQMFVVPL